MTKTTKIFKKHLVYTKYKQHLNFLYIFFPKIVYSKRVNKIFLKNLNNFYHWLKSWEWFLYFTQITIILLSHRLPSIPTISQLQNFNSFSFPLFLRSQPTQWCFPLFLLAFTFLSFESNDAGCATLLLYIYGSDEITRPIAEFFQSASSIVAELNKSFMAHLKAWESRSNSVTLESCSENTLLGWAKVNFFTKNDFIKKAEKPGLLAMPL